MFNETNTFRVKKVLVISLVLLSVLGLYSCGNSDAPLTEKQQAEKYNMSENKFQETKEAAARMNMTVEDHMKMTDTDGIMDMGGMDMGDDSSMIEDDSDMGNIHTMDNGTKMNNEEIMDKNSTHTMDNGTEMTDGKMHMEMMHEGEDTGEHGSDEHGEHE